MDEVFEIYGNQIPLKEIRKYRLIKKEYVYQPAYLKQKDEKTKTTTYIFKEMIPYAALYEGMNKSTLIGGNKITDRKEHKRIDVIGQVKSKAGNALDIPSLRSDRLNCLTLNGRAFTIYSNHVPVDIIMENNQSYNLPISSNNRMSFDGPLIPAIEFVDTLSIETAKNEYLFYGNGIHIENAQKEYDRLKECVNNYKEEMEKNGAPQKKEHHRSNINHLSKKAMNNVSDFARQIEKNTAFKKKK